MLASQTRLAQELHKRSEFYETYLVELLTLFADKGVAIQNLKIANHHIKVCTLTVLHRHTNDSYRPMI